MTQSQQVPQATDERLCWLAVRDHLGRKSRRTGFAGLLQVVGTVLGSGLAARIGGDMRRDGTAQKMGHYAFAVDAAADRLTADERRQLRATGEVPGWFLADVEQRAAERRKRR
ncbi:hypothetical protein [Kitasatospora sp. P5_F3]